jgi:peroxiredoxin
MKRTHNFHGARPATALVSLALLAALLGRGSAAQELPPGEPPSRAKLNEPAPPFALKDTKGQERKLEHYRDKILVLEWTDPQCEFVKRLYQSKVMQATFDKLRELDRNVAWLAISSTRGATPDVLDEWLKRHELKYPLLVDSDSAVADLYDARRAPHMFVIDGAGKLRYHGALDDDPIGLKLPGDRKNYVIDAVKAIVAGDPVAKDFVSPYGCMLRRAGGADR